jgi:NPCBM/NEW2 domain
MENGDPLTRFHKNGSLTSDSHLFTTLLCVSVPLWFVSDAVAQTATPRFELRSTREKPVVGTVEKLDFGGTISVAGQSVPVKEMVSLRRTDIMTPPWPKGTHAVLTNGDRVAGVPLELAGTFLRFRLNSERKEALRFPITWTSVLWLRSPESIEMEKLGTILTEPRNVDHVVLRNGDIASGTLTSLDSAKQELQIEAGGEKRSIALEKVVAIVFNNRFARDRKPAGPYGHLVLTNGTRLTVLSPNIQDGNFSAQTMFKDPVRVPLTDVAAVDIYQGAAVYLSDLKPAKYRYRSYQGEEFDWKADQNLHGRELQVQTGMGTQTFDKGIAVHGECTLQYDLTGKYRRFEALAGLDAQLGKRGNFEIRIIVDGKEQKVDGAKSLTRESGPMAIDLDVSGGKELTLIVGWGEGGNVGDYVNWCDARLIP